MDDGGFTVWLDRWSLIPGEHWQQEMARGLDEARTCAVCIGTTTPMGWFTDEIERALSRQTGDPTFRVIPVIMPGGDDKLVQSFLKLRTWVDFRGGIDDPDATHVLFSGIRGVPPGRPVRPTTADEAALRSVRASLKVLQDLRVEVLIDEEVHREYQRLILDTVLSVRHT